MLTRILDEKILEVLKGTSHEGSIVDIHKRERRNLLDAQLEADQGKVQEIFEEIEKHHLQSPIAEITKGYIGMDGYWITRGDLKALREKWTK